MAKPTYYELLQSPHWQRKRLEVCSRANFACEECGDTETTLNVHHQYYRKDTLPWDYPDDCFKCLCRSCHETRHGTLNDGKELLGKLDSQDLSLTIGYIKARLMLATAGPEGSVRFKIASYEEALGIMDGYSLPCHYPDAYKIIECVNADGTIGHDDIHRLREKLNRSYANG